MSLEVSHWYRIVTTRHESEDNDQRGHSQVLHPLNDLKEGSRSRDTINRAFGATTAPYVPKIMTSIMLQEVSHR